MLSWSMCVMTTVSVSQSTGGDRSSAEVALIARFILSCNCVWTVTVSVTKASILAQYLRIFDARYTRALCYFMLFLLVPAVAWGIFAGIFLCTPTAKLWNPSLAGHCRSAKSYWLSVAAIDIFLDFAVLVLPMPSIASLHLPRKQKLATIGMFTLGFLVCFVSVARIASVVISSDQGDHVMSGLWAIIWSSVEANVGISCACLLSLKALLTKLFPRLLVEDEPNPHHMHIRNVPDGWSSGDSEAATLSQFGTSWTTKRTAESSGKQRWTWSPGATLCVGSAQARGSNNSSHQRMDSYRGSD